MNDFNDQYEPTPEFLARLDRDVARAFRNEVRFTPTSAPSRARRLTMMVGIAAGALLTLVTGIVLGASATASYAADAPRSRLAIRPVKTVLDATFGCDRAAPVTASRSVAAGAAKQGVPVVDLSAPTAKTPTLGAIYGIKELPGGRLLVNDAGRRRIHLFDANLATSTIVFDTIPGSAAFYGRQAAPLIPYVGDSSLFRDEGIPNPGVMQVLDERGRVARALALFGGGIGSGVVGFPSTFAAFPTAADPKGRILVRASTPGRRIVVPNAIPRRQRPFDPSSTGRVGGGGDPGAGGATVTVTDSPDTLPVHRFDYEKRRVDTVGFFRLPFPVKDPGTNGGGKMVVTYGTNGEPVSAKQVINPLYVVDDWTVLSDGTVAFVRGQDYHVDWVHPDGSRSSSPKLPFEWRRLSDIDKQRIVDSTRAALLQYDSLAVADEVCRTWEVDSIRVAYGGGEEATRVYQALRNAGKLAAPVRFCGDTWRRYLSIPMGGRGAGSTPPRPLPNDPGPPPGVPFRQRVLRQFPFEFVPLAEIADYYPPIDPGAALADRDGNLWILPKRTSLSRNGELVYDVVNPKAGLVKRVRLPRGRSIAGFGKGGVVYLQAGDVTGGFTLERTIVPDK